MKTFKKSLSLIMAVLMVLSCWVWVAPTEAEAANEHENGKYYVKVMFYVANKRDKADATVYLKYKKNNGTGEQVSEVIQNYTEGNLPAKGTTVTAFEGYIDGYPTEVFYDGYTYSGGTRVMRIEDLRFYVGKDANSLVLVSDQPDYEKGNLIDDEDMNFSAYAQEYPKLFNDNNEMTGGAYVTGLPEANPAAINIPKINTVAEDKKVFSSNFSLKFYDQFGVRIVDDVVKNSLQIGLKEQKINDMDIDETFTKEAKGLWYENGNVWYNKDVQGFLPRRDGYKYYLYAHFTNSSLGNINYLLSTIELNYPEYTVNVNQQADIDAFNASMTMSDGNTQTDAWSFTGVYQQTALVWPTGVATKNGFNFYGFWSKPQPISDAAGYYAFEGDFARPVSTTDFVELYGGAEDGTYITKGGITYYNAGTRWDASIHKEVLGDVTYYGWWNSKDVSAKFYDVDGTYLGTQTTKYGKIEAADWYPDPKDGYNTGAYDYQGFANQWRDITGAVIHEGEYTFGPLSSLSLTPIYENKTYSDKYTVNFMNNFGLVEGGANQDDGVGSGKYAYRHILSGANIPQLTVPYDIQNAADKSYVFSGWSTQKPASGNYHLVAEGDEAFTENTDWVVREDITYYPVYRYTIKEYAVSFTYFDTTGTEKTDIVYIPYGSVIATPDNVNRNYAIGGYGYELEGWEYMNSSYAFAVLGIDDIVVLNSENIALSDSNLSADDPILFTSKYGKPQPTPYTVTFKYKGTDGEDKAITTEVYHGSKITAETVSSLAAVPAQYDDGEALYTFADKWIVTEGTADKAEYVNDEFTSFAPTSHVTFEAVYGEGVPFYTVTYHDGNRTYSERILQGLNVPAWFFQNGVDENNDPVMEEYVPADQKVATGTYKFAGWFDEKQTDNTYAETNGTKYTTADTVNGDLDLYSQFIFEPKKFTVQFVSFDGKEVLGKAEVEAGASFKAAYDEAIENTDRAADKVYSYTFIGWDYVVPANFLCEGKDMTYTAQYKPSYIYYEARWYADEDAMLDADPEMEIVGQDGLLAITNYTYEGAVYAPSVDLVIPDGKAFDGWYYLADGVETAYYRGMTITSNMNFYAKLKDAAKIFTVTTVVDGKSTDYKVTEGDTAEVVGRPLDGYYNETYHNEFVGWYTTADYAEGTEFNTETVITANTTIYAKFEQEEHKRTIKEVVTAPTYYAVGKEKAWCACSQETAVTTDIEKLTDTFAPTGTIYLGTQGKWSSTDEVFAKDDTNEYYANADTDIILTINDTAGCADAGTEGHTCVNCTFNPAGTGIGIKMIRAFVSSDTFTAEQAEEAAQLAITVFTDTSDTLNNTANYTVKVNSFASAELVDGEEYIIYYYAIDKANNVLNSNVRTAKFVYDISAPEFTIEGDSNAATATTSTVTYCGKAVIKNIENDATVTVNGVEVELTTADVSGTTAYTIDKAGNYIITVTDKAGNSTSKKIIVAEDHDEVASHQDVTCEDNGYDLVTCAVCKEVIESKEIESKGHQYGTEQEVAPTCTTDGYKVKTCSVCGDEVVTPGEVKKGHQHEKDENGELIYTVVTPATCSVEGKKISNCTVCGLDTQEATIPVDTENGHLYGATKILKATCADKGEKYQNCKYCFVKKTVEEIPALEHKDTGRYTKVTTAATCKNTGVETTYCKACDAKMGEVTIPATGKHIWFASTDPEKTFEATADKDGQITYECQTCDETKVEKIAKIEKYTVTFYGEDGTTKLFEIPAVVKGTTISKDYTWTVKDENDADVVNTIVEPTKAQNNEYKYTFAGWADLSGKAVRFPVDVTANISLKATFTATKRLYTHTFKINSDTDVDSFATIVGAYNDVNKKPTAVPTKAGSGIVRYEFEGWTQAGNLVTDFTMTEDKTFVAKFKAVAIEFNVVFYDEDAATVIWNDTFAGGSNAKYGNTTTVIDPETNAQVTVPVKPTKAADAAKHYTFAGWDGWSTELLDIDEAFGPINGVTRLYATYTGVDHSFETVDDATKTWAATCTKEGQTTEICTVCEYEKVTVVPMLDHNYVLQADGSKKCDGCGNVIAPEAKFVTITFVDDANKVLKEVEVEEGKTYTFTAPAKASTAESDFTFVKWVDADATTVSDTAEITVTAGTEDATYKAVYKAATRVYNVIFVNNDGKRLETKTLAYGSAITYTGATPERAYSADYHYAFKGWVLASGENATTVKGDTRLMADYTAIKHTFVETTTEATCQQTGGRKEVCSCGLAKPIGTEIPKLNHEIGTVVSYTAPQLGVAGSRTYICSMCEEEFTESIPELDSATIKVKVYNYDGELAKSATVELWYTVDGELVQYKANAQGDYLTDKNGFVSVVVPAEYEGWRAKVYLLEGGSYNEEVKTGSAENVIGAPKTEEPEDNTDKDECSCSCHKDTFWGFIFRLFQKIVKLFAGKAKCCSNPDSRI